MDQNSYKQILQLKNQLENYVNGQQFEVLFSFGYFLNQYIRRQGLSDKTFAKAIGVSDAAISQYINNHRKPTKEFMIRLELHSQGLFPALSWLKLLHKVKEHEIFKDAELRSAQRIHIREYLDLVGT